MIERTARDKQLSIHAEVPPELSQREFLGDAQRLGQILLNLLGNAVKFTESGTISIRAQILTDSRDQGIEVRFEVQDTGIGTTPDDQSRLFNLFEQADNSSTRKYGRTGLGLAISKRMVELMKGRIGVESHAGQGSRFWFSVVLGKTSHVEPERPTVETEQPLEIKIKQRFAGTGVLVVEDDVVNQYVINELLKDAGLNVDLANGGLEALDKIDTARHALVLMDMQMPRMDGISATVAIRERLALQTIPIVALTANAFDEDWQRCMDTGMDDFIAKPVDPKVIYSTIHDWLDRKAAQAAVGV